MHAVEFKNISKKFGTFFANEEITFGIEKNSVHCILGENGAGKTTLMKILFGIYKPDSGTIRVLDKEICFESPHDAIANKIGMVHQHFMLIDDFTVIENVILGNELTKGIKIDFGASEKILNALIEKFNLGIDLHKKISELSISQEQKVEILKLLYRNSEILIFDEPTAVLSPVEVTEFFKILEEFKRSGKTIILITHKLNEVKQIADRVSVLRRGKVVYEEDNKDGKLNIEILGKAIVGESVRIISEEKNITDENKEQILSLKNVSLKRENVNVLNDLNLKLKSGEIHGICGVEGNGQSEIVDIIIGLEKNFEGELNTSVKNISLVPDDRIRKGMIREFSIGENIILKKEKNKFIKENDHRKISDEVIKNYDVRVSNIDASLGSLSGGNQQKVIIAREVDLNNDILIFSHPTRGVDINATVFIHSKIIEQRNRGKSVLLISSDLDELTSLSDRLSVIYNGSIIWTFESGELKLSQENEPGISENSKIDILYNKIGKLMIGITH
ncbi:MAG: ABC transporter ATP-binding protein [bacterium]